MRQVLARKGVIPQIRETLWHRQNFISFKAARFEHRRSIGSLEKESPASDILVRFTKCSSRSRLSGVFQELRRRQMRTKI
jgi:hypothetical protein